MSIWTAEEITLLKNAYGADTQAPVDLEALARTLQRQKTNVCRKARRLGLTNQSRWMIPGGFQPPPRKFATDEERLKAMGERMRQWFATHEHPRGARGLTLSPESRAKVIAGVRRGWADPNSKYNSPEMSQEKSNRMLRMNIEGKTHQRYSRTSGGRRPDLENRYFRSAWEANYARFLNWLQARHEVLAWEFEPKTFIFHAIARGTRAYTPDFRVHFPDGRYEWHEVKGWMDDKSKTRLARMARYYPEEKIVLIDQGWFRQANRSGLAGIVPNWEHGTVR